MVVVGEITLLADEPQEKKETCKLKQNAQLNILFDD